MIKGKVLLFITLLLIIPSMSCAIRSKPLPEQKKTAAPGVPVTTLTWEEDWEKAIKAAQREGKVVIYSGSSPEIREAQRKAFEERFKITLEQIPGQATQLAQKILSEYRANIFNLDVYAGGANTMLTMLKPGGVLASLDPMLVLPEVLDTKVWYQGKLPFVDQAHTAARLILTPAPDFIVNTALAREVNSYQDVLNPKWKGKIILADPTMPPGGDNWFHVYVYSEVLSLDYMKALARQEPFISRDRRQAAEWLSRGKYAISIATGWSHFVQFADAGLPVKRISPLEGAYLQSGAGSIGLLKNPPHPNTAKVYINWVLSKEGAAVISRAYDRHSTRLDVPTEGLTPSLLRQPGEKYIEGDSEEIYLERDKYRKMAGEIFGHLLR